jgi:Na+/phosphate symporter
MDKSGANVGSARVRRLVSILLALASILALVYIYLTGHSGAESVWGWIGKN